MNFAPSPAIHRPMGIVFQILDPGMRDVLLQAGLSSYDDFINCRIGQVVHSSSTTCTRRLALTLASQSHALYLKTYRLERRRFSSWSQNKALREAQNYARMRSIDLNVPALIASGGRRRAGSPVDGFLLTREVPGAVRADDYFSANWPKPSQLRWDASRRRLLQESADMISRMHAACFFHVDLQWRNLLISEEAGQHHPYILDCSRGGFRIHPLTRAHGRLRDLSSLYKEARIRLTRTESLRWLRQYLKLPRLTRGQHALIHAIARDRAIKDGNASA